MNLDTDCPPEDESSTDQMVDELRHMYEKLLNEWKMFEKLLKKTEKKNDNLKDTIVKLEAELTTRTPNSTR